MVHCANPIVRDYMHGGDNELEEVCPPQAGFQVVVDNMALPEPRRSSFNQFENLTKCETFDYDVDKIMVRNIIRSLDKRKFKYRDNDLKLMRLVSNWLDYTQNYNGMAPNLLSFKLDLLYPGSLSALKVYLCQLKTQFALIEVHDEKPDYTMGQMLRDREQ